MTKPIGDKEMNFEGIGMPRLTATATERKTETVIEASSPSRSGKRDTSPIRRINADTTEGSSICGSSPIILVDASTNSDRANEYSKESEGDGDGDGEGGGRKPMGDKNKLLSQDVNKKDAAQNQINGLGTHTCNGVRDAAGSGENNIQITNQKVSLHSETLNRIRNYLLNYEPMDELDQDTIDATMLKMNKAAFLRREQKEMLDHGHRLSSAAGDEHCWDDDDLYEANAIISRTRATCNTNTNFLHSLVNVVDVDFFHGIIDDVEVGSTDFLLNQDTVNMIRDSLGIHDDGKKRKRRDLRVELSTYAGVMNMSKSSRIGDPVVRPIVPAVYDDMTRTRSSEKIENEIDDGRRRTRGMARDSHSKRLGEQNSSEHEGLELLLGAMFELENVAGAHAPIHVLEHIKQRNGRRNKSKQDAFGNVKDKVNVKVEARIRNILHATGHRKEVTRPLGGGKGSKRRKIHNDRVRTYFLNAALHLPALLFYQSADRYMFYKGFLIILALHLKLREQLIARREERRGPLPIYWA